MRTSPLYQLFRSIYLVNALSEPLLCRPSQLAQQSAPLGLWHCRPLPAKMLHLFRCSSIAALMQCHGAQRCRFFASIYPAGSAAFPQSLHRWHDRLSSHRRQRHVSAALGAFCLSAAGCPRHELVRTRQQNGRMHGAWRTCTSRCMDDLRSHMYQFGLILFAVGVAA